MFIYDSVEARLADFKQVSITKFAETYNNKTLVFWQFNLPNVRSKRKIYYNNKITAMHLFTLYNISIYAWSYVY